MSWFLLILAGLLEIVWASTMKLTEGWTRLWPSVVTLAFMGMSFALLSVAMKTLPAGLSYAVWTGIGAAGTVLVSLFLYKEPLGLLQGLCLAAIIGGIVGLKVTSGA